MNKYLEKIAGRQDDIHNILQDHSDQWDEIEAPIEDMHSDFEDMDRVYKRNQGFEHDPHHERLTQKLKDVREDRLRMQLDTDGQHQENDLNTAKRLMAIQGLDHLVNDDNADMIVNRFKNAAYSHSTNPSAIWKGLGTAAAIAGGAVAGGALGHKMGTTGGPILAGGALGAIAGGVLGYRGLGSMLDDRINARHEQNYEAREHAIEDAYNRLRSRLTPV